MSSTDHPLCKSYNVWCSVIKQFLGKMVKRHVLDIIHNISAVDLQVKRAYLLDFGIKNVKILKDFLESLQQSKCIRASLDIYQMGMDIMIVNPESFRTFLEKIHTFESDCYFINVSSSLEKPEVLKSESLSNELKDFIQRLPYDDKSISFFEIDVTGVNLTTVFGVLLGYPFVYWFDKDTDRNCLSMEPLRCFEVRWTLELSYFQSISDKNHTIFSFSLPESLFLPDTKTHVEKWISLKENLGVDLQISSRVETLPAVAL